MTNTLKQYRVSLACLVPHNCEFEIQAHSELEAYQIARNLFDEGYEGELVRTDADVSLNLTTAHSSNKIPDGAHIHKITG